MLLNWVKLLSILATTSVSCLKYTRRHSNHAWSYKGRHGPANWPDRYPTCASSHQNPINIPAGYSTQKPYGPLTLQHFFNKPLDMEIGNSGHTVQVNLVGDPVPRITGGPLLNHVYELLQFHFHWGAEDHQGSEHRIDNRAFPLEMHMVFWNVKYSSVSEAMQHHDGVTVMAVLFEVASQDNANFLFLHTLSYIQKAQESAFALSQTSLRDLLPSNVGAYFVLHGSLTTPPCSESVTWIIFKEPIAISRRQVKGNG
jgi:carbonic anhydrase